MFSFFNERGNASAVDNDVGVFGDMTRVDRHCFFVWREDGEFLFAALSVEGAEGPESGLREGESGLGSMAGGEGSDKLSFFGT